VKAVLIGFGYWGPNIARNLKESRQFELHGICDLDPAKLEKARGLYGGDVRYYTDYQEALADGDVKMVAVALRDQIGQKVARDVLRAGRHLFMEKPMATRMADALTLRQLAEQSSVLIHVDHVLIYNPIIRRVKAIMDSGELGELIFFESNRANLGPHIKRDMNAMWDLAVHDLAILDYLCGGKPALDTQCMGIRKFGDQEILTYMTVKFDGFMAMIKSSWFSPLKERTMIISGAKKMIVFDDLRDVSEKLMIYDKGVDAGEGDYQEYGKLEAKLRLGDLFVPHIEAEDSLRNSLEHFAECIRTGKPSMSGPDQAIRVLAILEQAEARLNEKR